MSKKRLPVETCVLCASPDTDLVPFGARFAHSGCIADYRRQLVELEYERLEAVERNE
jgi:hypothetical protein